MPIKKIRRFTKIMLISCNVIIAICLIIGSYGKYLNPQKYWFTGLFTLATLYFLLILIAFIVFWFFVKKIWMLIGIIAIAFSWNPLRNVVPLRWPHSFLPAKDPDDIRVMSWNVEHFDILEHRKHPERKDEMIDVINNYQPDVACFQEMVGSDSFSNAINFLPYFMKRMNMLDYHYSFTKKFDFDNKHHFGIIIFSKYPVINKQTISAVPNDYNNTFQYIDIVKKTDTFRVFNIHLQSLKFSNENRKYIDDPSMKDENDIEESKSVLAKFKTGFLKRRLQSDNVKQEIDKSPYPVIVCGDFNDVPNSYAYNTIGDGLKNVFVEKGAGIGRTFYSISPTLRIDNIFTDERFNVEQYVRIRKKLSDHFPVVADLLFEK